VGTTVTVNRNSSFKNCMQREIQETFTPTLVCRSQRH